MLFWFVALWVWMGPLPEPIPVPGGTLAETDSLTVPVMNYDDVKALICRDSDTTYIVNFWATWCVPCVQELPYFLALDSVMQGEPFRLILVSLDFRKDYLRRLQPFVETRKLERYVVAMDDNRMDYWINDIHPDWSGAIPATMVCQNGERLFYERTFHSLTELQTIIH